jgi:hypothetical protein
LGRVIAELAGELDRVHARREKLAAEIEEVFLAHPFGQLLQTLPGIGPRTGARILAEIGDGSRFATGDNLASYAGLAPVTRQSGKSLNAEVKSRRGNHRLKNAMFLAAFASLRSPESRTFYDANAPRRRVTTRPSSASPAAAATSSWPCSKPARPTNPDSKNHTQTQPELHGEPRPWRLRKGPLPPPSLALGRWSQIKAEPWWPPAALRASLKPKRRAERVVGEPDAEGVGTFTKPLDKIMGTPPFERRR